jgi:hypothetical protein
VFEVATHGLYETFVGIAVEVHACHVRVIELAGCKKAVVPVNYGAIYPADQNGWPLSRRSGQLIHVAAID